MKTAWPYVTFRKEEMGHACSADVSMSLGTVPGCCCMFLLSCLHSRLPLGSGGGSTSTAGTTL